MVALNAEFRLDAAVDVRPIYRDGLYIMPIKVTHVAANREAKEYIVGVNRRVDRVEKTLTKTRAIHYPKAPLPIFEGDKIRVYMTLAGILTRNFDSVTPDASELDRADFGHPYKIELLSKAGKVKAAFIASEYLV